MKHAVIATLGFLAVITGLSNSVQAHPTLESNSETEKYTLSRNATLEFESRTVEDDYQTFFGREGSTNISLNEAGRNSKINPNLEFFGPDIDGWQVNEDLILYVNEPFAPTVDAIPFERNRGENDRIEVQTNLIN